MKVEIDNKDLNDFVTKIIESDFDKASSILKKH